MSRNKIVAVVAVAILIGLGIVVAVNTNDDSSDDDVDGAFVTQMIPHHESAIEMAELAQEKGEHPQIIDLATNIVSSQSKEIDTLNEILGRLYGGSMDSQDHGDLGMSESMMDMGMDMGMDMDMDMDMGMGMDMESLETAKSFDREFIDQMIPHHQGAIRMARFELREGKDQEAKSLAMEIVDAQAAEIEQMNAWRKEWYGVPSPSGGVPSLDESVPDDGESMEG